MKEVKARNEERTDIYFEQITFFLGVKEGKVPPATEAEMALIRLFFFFTEQAAMD